MPSHASAKSTTSASTSRQSRKSQKRIEERPAEVSTDTEAMDVDEEAEDFDAEPSQGTALQTMLTQTMHDVGNALLTNHIG